MPVIGAGAGPLSVLAERRSLDAPEVSPFFAHRLEMLSTVRALYRESIPELYLEFP